VAASALLTLPFQAGVAIYFVARRLAISPGELLRAMSKSVVVTALSVAGTVTLAGSAHLGSEASITAFIAPGVGALIGWCLGIAVTGHPLRAELRLLASKLASGAPRLQAFRNIQSRLF
jgi:hypothetical protein